MKPQDVLLQLLEENEQWVHAILEEDPEMLYWQATPIPTALPC